MLEIKTICSNRNSLRKKNGLTFHKTDFCNWQQTILNDYWLLFNKRDTQLTTGAINFDNILQISVHEQQLCFSEVRITKKYIFLIHQTFNMCANADMKYLLKSVIFVGGGEEIILSSGVQKFSSYINCYTSQLSRCSTYMPMVFRGRLGIFITLLALAKM